MSNFAIREHPLHPMLVSLPIGLFISTLICDVLYLLSGRDMTWYDAATWAGAAGFASALVAAIPGLGDYLTLRMGSGARTTATLHMLANLALVFAFAAALPLMLDEGATGGAALVAVIALHVIGCALLVVSGWLGGELIYVHQVLFQDTQEAAERSAAEPATRPGQTARRGWRPTTSQRRHS
jgi:uncharacterized membrane protein